METATGFEVPSWNQIYEMLLSQAEKIRKSCFIPDIIVGVSRGGWLPARVLSDLLENPNVANVRIESYCRSDGNKSEPVLTQRISTIVAGKKVLIADELSDTGSSLKLLKEHVREEGASEVRIATLYHKPWSLVVPDFYEKQTSLWVVFPWEIKETIRQLIRKSRIQGKALHVETSKLLEAGLPEPLLTKFLNEIGEERDCSN
jgi:hypoxanthine phosphoribosyltransferase